MDKVVAHYQTGKVAKGLAFDFAPARDWFHLLLRGGDAPPMEIRVPELKALFFVKDLSGNGRQPKFNEFDLSVKIPGRKVRVRFRDGEVMQGFSWGCQVGRFGFFLTPADVRSNNERCYIVSTATEEITWL